MKKRLSIVLCSVIILCLVFIGFLYLNNDIGIPKSKLQSDLRSSQKIEDSWITTGDISETMAAFISYPDDKSDCTYSLYVNRPGLSFGYFFRGGGSATETKRYIEKITVENYSEEAYISLNQQNIVRVEIDDGNSIQRIEIEAGKPFALVFSANAGIITFYDAQGNSVDCVEKKI